jgi:hypothetical protein
VLQAGQNDVWIGIVNQAGEGNVFDLPLAMSDWGGSFTYS